MSAGSLFNFNEPAATLVKSSGGEAAIKKALQTTPQALHVDKKGINKAIRQIKKHQPKRIVIEATGRLEQVFIIAYEKEKLPIVIANPAENMSVMRHDVLNLLR